MTNVAASVLNRVIGEVVDMVDMEQLLGHVPINKVVAGIDLPEMINEIDLSGIMRAGAKGLGGETLDGARSGLMAMDQLSARLVDKVLRRKEPRNLVTGGESHERPQIVTAEVPP